MKEFDEMNENVEENEKKLWGCFFAKIAIRVAKIAILVMIIVGCLTVIEDVFKSLDEQLRYNSKASVTAGFITDKEIINGHYVPTVYRIHISAGFEYDGETHQGSNYFNVSEDVYNSYNVGDYFDSKDLLGYSNKDKKQT